MSGARLRLRSRGASATSTSSTRAPTWIVKTGRTPDYVDYSFYYDECCGYGSYIFDDAGNFIDPTQFIWGRDKYEMQSHELRISSPQDQRFRFVGGLFYARNQHDIEQRLPDQQISPYRRR